MNVNNQVSLSKLFLTFAKIGVLTFGGGYAMLPMLQREAIDKNNWCTEEDLLNYYAIGQCTPGIIAVNTATFLGYKTRGIAGGIVATSGVVFPSLVIISILYYLLAAFQSNIYVSYAMSGVQVAVAALITTSVLKMAKKALIDLWSSVIAVITLSFMLAFGFSPIYMILASIAAGLVISLIKEKRKAKQ